MQPFIIELCLADGLVRKPHGIVEDVIVRIEGCYFPVDFLVVDMKITKELSQAPIILGGPFLATVLRRNEQEIGWTLADLRGLDPSLCTHRIFLEDESRPVREAQRRLNPKVWEAMKEEILSGLMQRSSIPYRIASGLVPCTWFPRRQELW